MTNTGTVMAEWVFVPKNTELLISKPWLKFVPEDGILAPGETATIEVYLLFSSEIYLTECKPEEHTLVRDTFRFPFFKF
jgi:hypothetical protein